MTYQLISNTGTSARPFSTGAANQTGHVVAFFFFSLNGSDLCNIRLRVTPDCSTPGSQLKNRYIEEIKGAGFKIKVVEHEKRVEFFSVSLGRLPRNREMGGGGGGYLGQFLLGMCRWPLRTPTPL